MDDFDQTTWQASQKSFFLDYDGFVAERERDSENEGESEIYESAECKPRVNYYNLFSHF